MKKVKFVGLPLLALTAIAGLASCNGGGTPKQKPGVIFHAAARTINNDGEKAIDFKDKECAEVTVENEGSLKYGEQDVVVHIKPKKFFSFREYDVDTWAATSAPVHPYVGLGSPISLYNYQLQENVAWEFKDLSTPIEGLPGFYKQEYQITVKKEYFQKNIVIDYGNVEGINNKVYVYSSVRYDEMFNDSSSIVTNQEFYQVKQDASSFAVASKGATVTYEFNEKLPNRGLFSLNGWDEPDETRVTKDGKYEYPNFKLYGVKTTQTNGETKENLALYDPELESKGEDQLFVPTVDGDSVISFFINWELLAEGEDTGYANKYNRIEVEFEIPSSKLKENVHANSGVIYPGGLFQYQDANTKVLYKSENHEGTFMTYDPTDAAKPSYVFEHVFADESYLNTGVTYQVYYSILFELPEEEKNYFTVTIDGKTVFDIDLVRGPLIPTTWRESRLTGVEEGESELYYWTDSSGWTLVQLNPSELGFDGGPRTNLPEKFRGKDNLYYLYTTNISTLSSKSREDDSLSIEIETITPKYNTFALDRDSARYGKIDVKGGKLPCGDKNEVDIPFIPNRDYVSKNFEVEVYKGTDKLTDVIATYGKDKAGSGYAIHIHLTTAVFGEDESYTIKLALTKTKVKLYDSESKNLGYLLDENGAQATNDEYEPTFESGKVVNQIDIEFELKTDYDRERFQIPNVEVKYGGVAYYNFQVDPSKREGSNAIAIHVYNYEEGGFASEGDLIEISVKCVQVNYTDAAQTGSELVDPVSRNFVDCINQGFMSMRINFGKIPAEFTIDCLNIEHNIPGLVFSKALEGDFTEGHIIVKLQVVEYDAVKGIPNGAIFNITANFKA